MRILPPPSTNVFHSTALLLQGVLFDAYERGGVYLQTVQLQNTGTVMRQLRLLPPTSRYFQVSFPRQVHARGTLLPTGVATYCISPGAPPP